MCHQQLMEGAHTPTSPEQMKYQHQAMATVWTSTKVRITEDVIDAHDEWQQLFQENNFNSYSET